MDEILRMKDIYLTIDSLIDCNDIQAIDDLIISFISLEFSFQYHICLLASTLKIKESLKNRNELYTNAVMLGEKLMTREDTRLTLQGLE